MVRIAGVVKTIWAVEEGLSFACHINSIMCSPPWAGLPMSCRRPGSTTRSINSSGTCPISTGHASSTSVTSQIQSRFLDRHLTAPKVGTSRIPAVVTARRVRIGSRPSCSIKRHGSESQSRRYPPERP